MLGILLLSIANCGQLYAETAPCLSTKVTQTKISNTLVARKYVLGPNDIISLKILNVPELNQADVRVQPDGKISLLYLNSISVAGLSIEELQEIVEKKYSEFLVNPQISIKLNQSRPFIVYISGSVLNPGSYELNTITNTSIYYPQVDSFIERKTPLLSNIITAAGGVKHDADIEHVQVTNDIDGTTKEVNLLDLITKSDSSQDIYLMGGDKIFVPSLPSALAVNPENYKVLVTSTIFQKEIPIKVLGYVNKPGLVSLNSAKSANLNSAIAAAGGYLTDSAYIPPKVYISRLSTNNKIVTQKVNPMSTDIALMPNDIIYVPNKVRPVIGNFFDFITRMVYPLALYSNIRYNFKYSY